MIQVVDLIKDVIDSMVMSIKSTWVSIDSNGHMLCNVDKTWYLQPETRFTIGSSKYQVISFVLNETMTVKLLSGTDVLQTDNNAPYTFTLRNPSFYYGKVKITDISLNKITNKITLYPIIWIQENLQRTKPSEVDSAFDSTGTLRIFFLNNCKFASWKRTDHQTNIIEPLNEVVKLFLNKLKNSGEVGKLGTVQTVNHANFGVSGLNDASSTIKNMFSGNLSGIEIDPEIPILKKCKVMSL